MFTSELTQMRKRELKKLLIDEKYYEEWCVHSDWYTLPDYPDWYTQ